MLFWRKRTKIFRVSCNERRLHGTNGQKHQEGRDGAWPIGARTYEDLYEQHAQGVYRYLFSLGADADTAEDLTQETFCQALKSLDTFRGDCSPQTWLCAIAKRLWYKELERRRRFAPLPEDAPAPDSTVRETEERERRLALYRAMQRLDADTREVMHLRLSGDFSFREIGEILGRSEVWARVRFYRGKSELTKLFGGDGDG